MANGTLGALIGNGDQVENTTVAVGMAAPSGLNYYVIKMTCDVINQNIMQKITFAAMGGDRQIGQLVASLV